MGHTELPEERQQVDCLAEAIYYEARGEPERGQVAVAYTILNRAKDKSICEVTNAKGQFEYKTRGMYKTISTKSYQIAYSTIYGVENNIGSLYFYNPDKVVSKFHERKKYIVTIGNHKFFK